MVSAGHEYMAGTCGSGIVSSAADMLGMGGVGVVCEMCMCLALGGVGGEWIIGLGFTNLVETGGVLDVCLCRGGVCGVGRVCA